LRVSPDDRFFATSWETAQIANTAGEQVGAPRFAYLIQDYEPLILALGSESALARQTYEFPHFAVFSTEMLREYFRAHQLGVFAQGRAGDEEAAAFEPAIAAVEPPSSDEMRGNERKLLFHARPEQDAQRNMFELGLIALGQLHGEGALEGWVVEGIGNRQPTEVRHGDLRLKIAQRESESGYAQLLRRQAAGISLMLSPVPSFVSLEMAASGLPVVTNSFESKSAEALAGISGNLIAVEPTIEGVKAGVRQALAASTDHERRAEGANVRWSRSWDESFDPALIERLQSQLRA
jgi:hypothetical protein